MAPEAHVVLCGNIAVGKTTVAHLLERIVPGSIAYVEVRDEYLGRYYSDPAGFAFMNQLAYTLQFVEKAAEIATTVSSLVIQDRSIYDTHQVFSLARLEESLISGEEFRLLERAYRAADLMSRPSLMVLLDASPAESFARMARRGEEAEESVSLDYLADLRRRYLHWFNSFDVCPTALIATDSVPVEGVASEVLRLLGRSGRMSSELA